MAVTITYLTELSKDREVNLVSIEVRNREVYQVKNTADTSYDNVYFMKQDKARELFNQVTNQEKVNDVKAHV